MGDRVEVRGVGVGTSARPGGWAAARLSVPAGWARQPPRGMRVARGGSPDDGDEPAAGIGEADEDSPAVVQARAVSRFLSEQLGLGEKELKKVIDTFPGVLGFSVDNLRIKVRFLADEVGLGKDGAVKVIIKSPSVLSCSVENNLKPTVRYLVGVVGLGKEGAVKVITGCPPVLGMSVENNIAPKVRFLAEEVGLGKEGAVKVITANPSVLGMSVENNITPKVTYLVEEVGLGKEGAAEVIIGCPSVLNFSMEDHLRPKVRYLVEEVGLGNEGAAKVITGFPQVLSLSVDDNLWPKLRFLVEEAGAGPEGAADIILAYPTLLASSIERNLRPRLHFLLEIFPGIRGVQAMRLPLVSLAGRLMPRVRLLQRQGQAGRFVASSMAVITTAEFCAKVGIKIEEYAAEVEVCKREHEERYPVPAGVAAAGEEGTAGEGGGLVVRAELANRSWQESVNAGVAHNKANYTLRNAVRGARQMTTNQ